MANNLSSHFELRLLCRCRPCKQIPNSWQRHMCSFFFLSNLSISDYFLSKERGEVMTEMAIIMIRMQCVFHNGHLPLRPGASTRVGRQVSGRIITVMKYFSNPSVSIRSCRDGGSDRVVYDSCCIPIR